MLTFERELGINFVGDDEQIMAEDPSGNPIELFEAIEGYHERPRTPVTRRIS